MTKIGLNGRYKIINKETGEIIVEKTNLITDKGLAQLINSFINDKENHYLNSLAFGFGTTTPSKSDTQLTNMVKASSTEVTASETNKEINLTADFNSDNLNKATEIGVFVENNVLFTRDLLAEPLAVPSGSIISVEYTITFNASTHILNWKAIEGKEVMYYVSSNINPATIKQIYGTEVLYFERVSSLNMLASSEEFYYDATNKILYCYPYMGDATSLYLIED